MEIVNHFIETKELSFKVLPKYELKYLWKRDEGAPATRLRVT